MNYFTLYFCRIITNANNNNLNKQHHLDTENVGSVEDELVRQLGVVAEVVLGLLGVSYVA